MPEPERLKEDSRRTHEPMLADAHSATNDGLTIAPALDVTLERADTPAQYAPIDGRVLQMCGLTVALGVMAAFVAQALIALIAFTTNLAFYGRLSVVESTPAEAVAHLGLWVIPIPIIGALLVGLMARYGSKAIRGHGIPEAMEQVLTNQSRIPARITFLKPASAAISIGTGGPFGAEGPIIATGSALGSLIGQLISTTTGERKTLLAAGAAAGMTATFGSPVSAVLLAIELLLFEYRPRSIIPVALAAVTAEGVRMMFVGMSPVFAMSDLTAPTGPALVIYLAIGAIMGCVAAGVTKLIYAIEDGFEGLPVHWMWWPALGAVAVGIMGYLVPATLGVGYGNITGALNGQFTAGTLLTLAAAKLVSWSISLGSGTSGGTMAPLFTIGGALGGAIGMGIVAVAPWVGVDPRIAALVGMATMFAGASRAMLACAVFAFETTMQPLGLLPLLGGCAAAYLTSSLLSRNSLMTEKIARRGIKTPSEYMADALDQVQVREIAAKSVISLRAEQSLASARDWIATGVKGTMHQGFPLLNERGVLVGVLTRRDLLDATSSGDRPLAALVRKSPKFVYEDCTVRQAADHMVSHQIGRLPVLRRGVAGEATVLVGMVTRSDVLSVFQQHVDDAQRQAPSISWGKTAVR